MALIRSLEDLNRLREAALLKKMKLDAPGTIQFIVGVSSCGIAAGALSTLEEIKEQIRKMDLKNVYLSQTGCSGLCTHEPIVQLIIDGNQKLAYGRVSPTLVRRIFEEHIKRGQIVKDLLIDL
jgi:NADP-reducing hydrogenase subunit HndB